MDIKEIEWESVDWIYLAQDTGQWQALGNMVTNLTHFARGEEIFFFV
jgi:hypothetical protein